MEEIACERVALKTGNELAAYLYLCKPCKTVFTSITEFAQHNLSHSDDRSSSARQHPIENETTPQKQSKAANMALLPVQDNYSPEIIFESTRHQVHRRAYSAQDPLPREFEVFVRLPRISTCDEPLDLSQHAPSHQAQRKCNEKTSILEKIKKLFASDHDSVVLPRKRASELVQKSCSPKRLKIDKYFTKANPLQRNKNSESLEVHPRVELPESSFEKNLAVTPLQTKTYRKSAQISKESAAKFAKPCTSVSKQNAEEPNRSTISSFSKVTTLECSSNSSHLTSPNLGISIASPKIIACSPKLAEYSCIESPKFDVARSVLVSVPVTESENQNFNTTSRNSPKPSCLKSAENNSIPKSVTQNLNKDKRPFDCVHCNTSWPSSKSLQTHTYRKHGLKNVTTEARRYKCDLCPFTTLHRSTFYHHKNRHKVQLSHKCDECTCTFVSRRSLARHVNREHSKVNCSVSTSLVQNATNAIDAENVESDPICNKEILQSEMTSHRSNTHPEVNPYYCTECPFTCSNYLKLWHHKQCHSVNRPYKCCTCTASFTSSLMANRHILRENNGTTIFATATKGKTKSCTKQTPTGIEIGKGTGYRKFECTLCHNKYFRLVQLSNHMRTHTNKNSERITCAQDQNTRKNHYKTTYNKRGSRKHGQQPKLNAKKCQFPKKPEEVACSVCGVTVAGVTKLNLHYKIYHPSYEAYKCTQCPYRTAKQESLLSHSTIHKVADVFKCPYCTGSFSKLTKKQIHIMELHPGQPCDTPEVNLAPRKVNGHPEGYYRDMEETTKSRNTLCRICEEQCNTRRLLETHFAKKHPDTMPYVCSDCPYATTSYGSIWKHDKLHSIRNKFECHICSASFRTTYWRSNHVLNVHREQISHGCQANDKIESSAEWNLLSCTKVEKEASLETGLGDVTPTETKIPLCEGNELQSETHGMQIGTNWQEEEKILTILDVKTVK